MNRILVVDDDVRMARIVETFLLGKNYRVSVATSGPVGLEMAAREAPDLLILDVMMPGMTGLELCRALRTQSRRSQLPVIFLSGKNTTDDRIAGLEAGADDYLAKPFDLRELELRVEALLRRTTQPVAPVEQTELQVGNLRLDRRTYKAYAGSHEVQLTPVEFELLQYLMLRAGEVVSAEQLLQEVWRYYPGTGDAAVVRVQIMNLRDKIEKDRQNPRYIQTIYRHGYTIAAC